MLNYDFMWYTLLVAAALTGVGAVILIIMKLAKAKEKPFVITVLATLFCALIASGALVYIVSLQMMNDYIGIRRYKDYQFINPSGSSITVKEYSNAQESGFEVHIRGEEAVIAEFKTDHYLPFANGEDIVRFDQDTVVIHYTFKNTDDAYEAREVTVDLKEKTASEPKKSTLDLRVLRKQS